MTNDFRVFQLALFLALELGILAHRSFRDLHHVFAFAVLFAAALLIQELSHGDRSFRRWDPLAGVRADENDRVTFAGTEMESGSEASRENSVLGSSLTFAEQAKTRVGMVAVMGGYIALWYRLGMPMELACICPVVAALMIVPAVGLNHLILPLGFSALGVLFEFVGRSGDASSAGEFAYCAIYLLGFALALSCYQRLESPPEDQVRDEPAVLARVGKRLGEVAPTVAVFALVLLALNLAVPDLFSSSEDSREPGHRPGGAFERLEEKILKRAADEISKRNIPAGTGSPANSSSSPPGNRSDSTEQSSAAGLPGSANPAVLASASRLAQAMSRASQAGETGSQGGDSQGPGASPASPANPASPKTRAEAEELLKKWGNPAGSSGAEQALPSGTSEARPKAGTEAAQTQESPQTRQAPQTQQAHQAQQGPQAQQPSSSGGKPSALAPHGPGVGGAHPAEPELPASDADLAQALSLAQKLAHPQAASSDKPTPKISPSPKPALSLWPRPETLRKWLGLAGLLFRLGIAALVLVFLSKLLSPKGSQEARRLSVNERRKLRQEFETVRAARLKPREEILASYHLYLKIMAVRGFPKEDWLPPTDFGHMSGRAQPELISSSRRLTDDFCQTCYSDTPLAPDELVRFRLARDTVIHVLLQN